MFKLNKDFQVELMNIVPFGSHIKSLHDVTQKSTVVFPTAVRTSIVLKLTFLLHINTQSYWSCIVIGMGVFRQYEFIIWERS
jgi:hypothetical protein